MANTVTAPVPVRDVPIVRRPIVWWAALPALLMALTCAPFAGRRSLWQDETISWAQATVSWSDLVTHLHTQDLVFAPYYGLLHVWLRIDQGEAWLRTPSLIAAVGTVWVIGVLGHRLWGNRLAGLLSGGLLAVHPSFAAWALQARPYTLATLAVAASGWYLTAAGSERGKTRHWVGYALVTAAGGYLHLFTLLMLPVHMLAQLAGRRFDRRALAATAAVVLLSSPLVLTLGQSGQVAWIGALTWKNVTDGLIFLVPTRLAAALLLLALVGLAVRLTQGPGERFAVVLTLGWAVAPISVLLAVSTAHPIFQDRYVVFVIPGLCLAAAGGWTAFFPAVLAVRARSAVLLALIVAVCWAVPLRETLLSTYYIDDFKGLAQHLDDDPEAQRIVVSPPWVATGLAYYERDTALAARWREVSNGPGETAWLERSPTTSCSRTRLLLRSDLSEADRVAGGLNCRPGKAVYFGYLTLITLKD